MVENTPKAMETDIDNPEFTDNKLIEAVKKHKCLYDKKHPGYYKKSKREHAWNKITNKVGKNIDICQNRWKLLREKYGKEIKKRERASEKGKIFNSNLPFYDKLSFLDDHIELRRKSTSDSKRFYLVPAYENNVKVEKNEEDNNCERTLSQSTNDSMHSKKQKNQSYTKNTPNLQSSAKRQRTETLNNYASADSSDTDNEDNEVNNAGSYVKAVLTKHDDDEMDTSAVQNTSFVQQQFKKSSNINNLDSFYDVGNKEQAKPDHIKSLERQIDDSDTIYGKMVTTMLKDISVDDIKDDVKLQILQSLIKAKRRCKNQADH